MTIDTAFDRAHDHPPQGSSETEGSARTEPSDDADVVVEGFEPSPALRWLMAALSAGAAAIHLAMVPQHAQASLAVGLAFAAAGWFQLAFAVAILVRPTRSWVQAAIAANVALIALWAWSRTVGLPEWTGDGGVEPVSAVDALCVALEAAVVCTGVLALAVPNALKNLGRGLLVAATIVPIGILVAATAVIASPGAADHAHGGASHDESAAAGAGSAPHEHGATPAQGEVAPDDGNAAPQTDGHDHSAPAADGADARHHGESEIAYEDLPADTKAEVDQVKDTWALKYPTAADATAAGWFKATPNLYGIGAHYIRNVNGFSVAEPFDMLNPNILLYDGEGPDAKFAGVSYVVAGAEEGFSGSDDFWHAHESVCMKDGKISLTEEASAFWYSESECTAVGGRVMPIAADTMMHLWIGPGYTDAPVFAHDNPEIFDGYYPKQPA